MVGRVVFAALAALTAASCGGGDDGHFGCFGSGVIIAVTIPVDAGTADASADGGSAGGRPGCNASCIEYIEALRVAIETATSAACMQLTHTTGLVCAPNAASWCGRDTADASTALEAQIRDYLAAARPEIDSAAVSVDTCLCHVN